MRFIPAVCSAPTPRSWPPAVSRPHARAVASRARWARGPRARRCDRHAKGEAVDQPRSARAGLTLGFSAWNDGFRTSQT